MLPRFVLPLLFILAAGCTPPTQAQDVKTVDVAPAAQPLVQAARDRLDARVVYDGRYVRLDYPGGDVSPGTGVCTDVIIRSYRAAYGFDLQRAVHEDMRANFDAYPENWGLTRPDRNIDHRRVPNLETWFTRAGHALPMTENAADYRPGDVVSWRLSGSGLPHIGIVSERLGPTGTPLIIHNIGRGPEAKRHAVRFPHYRAFPVRAGWVMIAILYFYMRYLV